MSQNLFQRLLKEMEDLLGCWRSIFLPLSSDPELSKQAQLLCKSLSVKGVTVNEDLLKVFFVLVYSSLHWPFSYRRLTAGKDGTDKASTAKIDGLCFRLCCRPLLCSLKKILKSLAWEFVHSGTWSVTTFFIQPCPGWLTETSPRITWFSFWTRLVSS